MSGALESIAKLFADPSFNKVDHPLSYNVVIEVLCRFYDRIEWRNASVWTSFHKVCRQLPQEQIDRITLTQGWCNLTEEQFKRLLSVRCDLVTHSSVDKSWSWLNAVLDNVDKNQIMYVTVEDLRFCIKVHIYFFSNPSTVLDSVTSLLIGYAQEREVCLWAMELLSKIQSVLSTEPLAAKKPSFLFLLDVFYTIVIVRSGFVNILHTEDAKQIAHISRQNQLEIFPEALYQLMTLDAWNDCEARVSALEKLSTVPTNLIPNTLPICQPDLRVFLQCVCELHAKRRLYGVDQTHFDELQDSSVFCTEIRLDEICWTTCVNNQIQSCYILNLNKTIFQLPSSNGSQSNWDSDSLFLAVALPLS